MANLPAQTMMPSMMPFAQQKKGFGTKLKEGLFGSPGQVALSPLLNPQQQNLQGLTIQNLMQMLQQGNQGPAQYQNSFAPIAQNARENFYSNTVPSLAERFTALGGGQNSSAFQGALGQAGAGLESDLGAMGAQFGQQQQQLDQGYLLNLLKLALAPQFESSYIPGKSGLLGGAGNAVGQGIGSFGSLGLLKYLGLL
jgi:hypothetical protein